MWLLTLAACMEPAVTSPTGMVGVVRGDDGLPRAGVVVQSVEARSVTDAEGRFRVDYKEPDRHVTIHHGDAWLRRTARDDDLGAEVRITLPKLEERALDCRLQAPCTVRLAWRLGEIEATATARCAPGGTPLGRVPGGDDLTATCEGSDASLGVTVAGRRVQVAPAPARVTVRVDGLADAAGCHVRVGAGEARPHDGAFVGEAAGSVTVSALCGDRPAVPRSVFVDSPTEVVLAWQEEGPEIDLRPLKLDIGGWTLIRVGADGWSLPLSTGDGVLRLPPLAAGSYGLLGGGDLVGLGNPGLDAPEGVMGVVVGDGKAWGRVTLPTPVTRGALRWHRGQAE